MRPLGVRLVVLCEIAQQGPVALDDPPALVVFGDFGSLDAAGGRAAAVAVDLRLKRHAPVVPSDSQTQTPSSGTYSGARCLRAHP